MIHFTYVHCVPTDVFICTLVIHIFSCIPAVLTFSPIWLMQYKFASTQPTKTWFWLHNGEENTGLPTSIFHIVFPLTYNNTNSGDQGHWEILVGSFTVSSYVILAILWFIYVTCIVSFYKQVELSQPNMRNLALGCNSPPPPQMRSGTKKLAFSYWKLTFIYGPIQ